VCTQECALYGELVLYLRDRAAGLLAGDSGDVDAERTRLDAIIRDWFFTSQDELHGCAPRDLIWAEQKGEPNPIHPDRMAEFFEDDCPVCQAMYQEVKAGIEAGEEHGWQWHHDDGGCPLISIFDPEGWDERWAEEDAAFERWQAEQAEQEAQRSAPAYEPPPVEAAGVPPEEFIARARQPWLDPALHHAARALADHVDCPEPTLLGLHYRRLTYDEALSLAVGLHEHGADVEALLTQIQAFPYQNVALDWLSQPEENVAMFIQAMEQVIAPDDEDEMARFRHHRDFVLTLARVIHPGARLWLQGWLDAVAHGAFARAGGGGGDVDGVF
jgi:hypothetical protein